jgi:preprotein translocase subunit SecG
MNKEVYGGIAGTITSIVGTSMQTNEVLQMISLILTIIGTIITIAMALLNWYKQAKRDGKITKDEIKDAVDIISDGIEDIKSNTKGENK